MERVQFRFLSVLILVELCRVKFFPSSESLHQTGWISRRPFRLFPGGWWLNPEVKRTGLRGFAARHTMAQRVSRFSQQSFPSRTSFVGSVGAASSEKSDSFLHDDSDVLDLSKEEEPEQSFCFMLLVAMLLQLLGLALPQHHVKLAP